MQIARLIENSQCQPRDMLRVPLVDRAAVREGLRR